MRKGISMNLVKVFRIICYSEIKGNFSIFSKVKFLLLLFEGFLIYLLGKFKLRSW